MLRFLQKPALVVSNLYIYNMVRINFNFLEVKSMSEKFSDIACIILASGLGRRYGSNKLLATIGDAPMVQHILDITCDLFDTRAIITRHQQIANLACRQHIECVLHDLPLLSDTVRLGTAYALQRHPQVKGLLFAVSDQPLLTQASLTRLCQNFANAPQRIHRLAFSNTPGNPIIFPATLAEELQKLPADKGGSYLAKKYPELVTLVPVQDKNELFDIDTKEDLISSGLPCFLK